MNEYLETDLHKEYDNISFCTMCFNIGMERVSSVHNHDRQEKSYIDYYVMSLIKLCRKFKNMIIFCDKECADILTKNKVDAFIYQMKLENLEKYTLLQKYTEIYRRMKRYWKLYIRESSIVRKTVSAYDNALYTIINQSKIDLMFKACQINPANSKTMIWIDAGCCQERYSNIWGGWDGKITERTAKMRCTVHTCGSQKIIDKSIIKKWNLKNIIYNFKEEQMAANIFMADILFFPIFYKKYNALIEKLISKNLTTSEQSIITWMIHEDTSLFDIIVSTEGYGNVMQKICNEKNLL